MDYSITRNPNDAFDAAVLWQDETFVEVPDSLASLDIRTPVINLNCTDISKQRVEQALNAVFGVSSFIDPLTYQGKCIKKPDGNAIRPRFCGELSAA